MGKKDQPSLEGHVSGQSNKPLSRPAHALPPTKVLDECHGNAEDGLSTAEAQKRQIEYGPNDIGEGEGVKPGKILIRQVANAMTVVRDSAHMDRRRQLTWDQVLILAMAVSFGIQSWIEGGVVAVIIMLNIVVGFMQEYNAEKTMDSLRSLSSPTATTIRDGKTLTIPTPEIVVGDMVEMKTGDTIPADVR